MTQYEKIKKLLEEAKAEGEDHIFVGREFYKDEFDTYADNHAMTMLTAEGYHFELVHNHEWQITW